MPTGTFPGKEYRPAWVCGMNVFEYLLTPNVIVDCRVFY